MVNAFLRTLDFTMFLFAQFKFSSILLIWHVLYYMSFSTAFAQEVFRSENRQESASVIVATITTAQGQKLAINQDLLLAAHQLVPPSQSLTKTLEQVIDLFVLAEQAKIQNLDQHPQALDEKNRAALRHFISDEFEQTYRLDTLPQQYINQATRQNIGLFVHPELRQGSHILLKPLHSQEKPMSDEEQEELLPYVKKVQRDLDKRPIHNTEELQKRVLEYRPWMPTGYEIIFENLGRFSAQGPFVSSFNKACFAQQEVPALVGPILTQFGFHFTWLEEIIPPLNTPPQEIEKQVKQRILPEVRSYEWRMLIGRLIKQAEQNEQAF